MLNGLFKDHLRRVRTAVLKRHTAASISSWLTENTTYAMQPFSYKDHEYQEAILSDTSVETNTRKCSQVGISEVLARKALGLVNVLQPYTVIYTVPTAHFAGTFMKTRVDPVIQGSKTMREMVHRTNDNSEMKQFGDSMLYCKGAASSNAPISIPADHLIHDEVDFCDQDVLTQYQSRLTHSPWRKIDRFSTPTLPNFGIDKFFQESRRHYLMVKCDHCNHDFVPSYYDHVKIPGFDDDLRKITKYTLTRIRWEEAAVICPHCGKAPSLQWPHRRWVCGPSGQPVRRAEHHHAQLLGQGVDQLRAVAGLRELQPWLAGRGQGSVARARGLREALLSVRGQRPRLRHGRRRRRPLPLRRRRRRWPRQ
jgi:phage terminase large subunit GpA-like protein